MSKYAYMWPMRVPKGPYYKRHQQRVLYDGTKVKILDTRFTCGKGLAPKPGPRGGEGFVPFLRNIYYMNGVFYRSVNTPLAIEGTYEDRLFPVDGTIWTKDFYVQSCHDKGIPVAKIHCESGYPIFGTLTFADGETISWDNSQSWEMVAYQLDLVCKQRKSPAKRKVTA